MSPLTQEQAEALRAALEKQGWVATALPALRGSARWHVVVTATKETK